jgi:hypothetical protein
MSGPDAGVGLADWLALREPADAGARSVELLDRVALPPGATVVDLGSGTGSMARWVAGHRPSVRRWVLVDRDADLLRRAYGLPGAMEHRPRDLADLTAADLSGADLVTASALLDVLTADQLERVADACAAAGCPVLVTLTVAGRVALTPADPLDAEVAAAFDAHQRRALLGPDATSAAVRAFGRRGMAVEVRPSPWRLSAAHAALAVEWLRGWVAAACEQRPELAGPAAAYSARRRADAAAGRLTVVVEHTDLLATR